MQIFDRIVMVVLVLGIWALVLSPREIGAHHYLDDGHSCNISGKARGYIDDLSEGGRVIVKKWSRVRVRCGHS